MRRVLIRQVHSDEELNQGKHIVKKEFICFLTHDVLLCLVSNGVPQDQIFQRVLRSQS